VNVIDRFFNRLMDLCMLLAKLMLLTMTIIICIHVFYRYALNQAIRWSEEITMMLMVYMGFFSIAYGVKHRLHLSVNLFYDSLPAGLQRIILKLTDFILMIMGLVLLYFGISLIKSTMHNIMIATHLPSAMLYGAVPVSGILIAYFSFVNFTGWEQKSGNGERREHHG
jgi:TRAP-type C4-dicarboxylate transport system permease small subunit